MNENPIKLLVSYAHKDTKYREELETHLEVMKQKGEIAGWSDNEMARRNL